MPYFNHNGYAVYYEEQGAGDPVLLIPGSTTAVTHYTADMDRLAEMGYHAICFDWPGTGRSDRMQKWPARWLENVANCGAALLDCLEIPSAVVMGASGGAMAALLMAIQTPEKVSGVIADSTGEAWNSPFIASVVKGRQVNMEAMRAFWELGHGDDWWTVVNQDNIALLDFAARGDDWLQGRLVQINLPVLFCGSLQDELITDIGEQIQSMAQQIPGSRIFLTYNGGHPLMWSYPELFYEQVEGFLRYALSEPALAAV